MKNKKIGWVWKVFLAAGIFAAAGSLYFFAASGNGDFLKSVVSDSSAVAVNSWNDVFSGAVSPQQSVSDSDDGVGNDEVDLGRENSSTGSPDQMSSGQIFSSSPSGEISENKIITKTTKTTQTTKAAQANDAFPSSSVDSASDENFGDVIQSSTDTDGSIENSSAVATPVGVAKSPAQLCAFVDPDAAANGQSGDASRAILLNEVAWMGSLPQDGETGAKASEREWIELKNISSGAVDISGWQILDSLGNLKMVVAAGTTIPAGGFYLLVRGGDSLSGVQADASYAGALPNTGDNIELADSGCGVSDFLDASAGWPAGNNTTKQTMERDADGAGWHSSVSPGGTPRAENSVPASAAPTPTTTSPTASLMPSVTSTSEQYLVSASIIGAGVGTVSSSPAGILCGFACQSSYAGGTKISFAASPAAGSLFKGWSGACAGADSGTCSFTVSSSVSVVAQFDVVETPPPSLSSALSSTSSTSPSSAPTSSSTPPAVQAGVDHLVIAAIQIAGASSSNDFIKIFNPTPAAIDISGWKLHKKSNTGTDYSLRTFPSGSVVAGGGYFVWANSLDGFSESIAADASSTETLSPDNSAGLFDANGNAVDEVAWGTGTNQYVEGSAYPTNPVANQILTRIFSNGAIVDTDDNAADFTLP